MCASNVCFDYYVHPILSLCPCQHYHQGLWFAQHHPDLPKALVSAEHVYRRHIDRIGVCIDASVILITQLNVTKPFIWNWPAECCCYHYTLARSPKNLGKFKELMQLYYVVLSQFLYSFLIPSTGKISIWFILHFVLWLAISNMESCSKTSLIAPWLCLLIQSNWVCDPRCHTGLSNKVASSADTKASQHLLNTRLNHVRLLTRLAWPL